MEMVCFVSDKTSLQRYIVFGYKTVGKKNRRKVEVARFYLSEPVKGVKPFFEARAGKDQIIAFLNILSVQYELLGPSVIAVQGSDPDFYVRRAVVYAGLRQHIDSSIHEIRELVARMSEVEAVFWYTKFLDAYENRGFWGVYRVAKSFRTLYRL